MFFMGKVAYHLFQNSLDQKTAKSPGHSPFNDPSKGSNANRSLQSPALKPLGHSFSHTTFMSQTYV